MDHKVPTAFIDDELWPLVEPMLAPPQPRRKRYDGRLPVPDRAALNGSISQTSLLARLLEYPRPN